MVILHQATCICLFYPADDKNIITLPEVQQLVDKYADKMAKWLAKLQIHLYTGFVTGL